MKQTASVYPYQCSLEEHCDSQTTSHYAAEDAEDNAIAQEPETRRIYEDELPLCSYVIFLRFRKAGDAAPVTMLHSSCGTATNQPLASSGPILDEPYHSFLYEIRRSERRMQRLVPPL